MCSPAMRVIQKPLIEMWEVYHPLSFLMVFQIKIDNP
jgi:hypothetical protein